VPRWTGAPAMAILPVDLAGAHAELGDQLEEAAVRVLRSGRYVDGPELAAFEREFASFCGVRGAVGTASGLDALRLTLEALSIGAGDEVIVPAHTAVATWLAVSAVGARPVPVEPDPTTLLIDGARIDAAIGPRTAAIVVVHLHGLVVDIDPIARLARGHHLALVEDASQAHGARYFGRHVGRLADAAAFSLYPTKNLGAYGDGGVVTSDDERLLEQVRLLGRYGARTSGIAERRGSNSRLDELQAALLRVKLAALTGWNGRRRAVSEQYRQSLGGLPRLELPAPIADSDPVWHHFVVRLAERERIRRELSQDGIGTLVHYPVPPHLMPAYEGFQLGPLPVTEGLASEVLSLPIGPHLTAQACERICQAVAKALVGGAGGREHQWAGS
jgi:dTDP-3-amino-3,4,6-trideoxy-alpha-D-glucose transaminase